MYTQCTVQYEDKSFDTLWVESEHAKVDKIVVDEDRDMRTKIVEVFGGETLTKEELRETQRLARKYDNNI